MGYTTGIHTVNNDNNDNNKIYFQSKQITAKYANIYYGADKLDL